MTAGGAGVLELGVETVWAVDAAGPAGVAPLSRPWAAGSRYVVAEIVAVICGKPTDPGPRVIALSVISRPLTDRCWLPATTNRWSRPRKLARWKKFPWKVNVNGSIGNPAGPIVAPGGSDAVEDCAEDPVLAGAGLPPDAPALKVKLWKSTPVAVAAACSW